MQCFRSPPSARLLDRRTATGTLLAAASGQRQDPWSAAIERREAAVQPARPRRTETALQSARGFALRLDPSPQLIGLCAPKSAKRIKLCQHSLAAREIASLDHQFAIIF